MTNGTNQRAEAMVKLRMAGVTLEEIGRTFGVTRQRAEQILKATGRTDLAEAVAAGRREKRAEAARAERTSKESACLKKWGISLEEKKRLRSDGTIRAFESHRQTAHARGIEFRLTFAEWFGIWQESGNWHLRGRGKGRFCMSRRGDTGPYAVGNVFIQPCESNGRDAVDVWRGKTKKTRGVFNLYPGLEKPFLAKAGKKSLGLFRTEAEAAEARRAYLEANPLSHPTALGSGKGWTYRKGKPSPYMVQFRNRTYGSFRTEEEARARYLEVVAEYKQSLAAQAAQAGG